MRRAAPSLSAEPVSFDWLTFARRARAFERFTDPAGAALLLVWAPRPAQQRKASASDVDAIAHLYGVPPAALKAIAEIEGDRRLCQIEANAGRLRRALDAGADLSDIFYPAVMARIIDIEAALGGTGA
ncbi:hypothetical protein [Xanthobacter aminoxidans]|uniref:hypothetical protein n=1 Tax=Xanthobacter aminoxidans TaxID=186280 RepID=UPI00372A82DC